MKASCNKCELVFIGVVVTHTIVCPKFKRKIVVIVCPKLRKYLYRKTFSGYYLDPEFSFLGAGMFGGWYYISTSCCIVVSIVVY